MNYQEVIKTRRSIRSFQDRPVKFSIIDALLNEAILAPSAHNRQPWRFLVLDGKEKNWIADVMEQRDPITKNTARVMREAPLIILVWNCEENHDIADYISIGGMIEQFCLSATNQGLGTLWMTYPLIIEKEIQQKFAIAYELISIIALGYAKEEPSPRPRKELEELLLTI